MNKRKHLKAHGTSEQRIMYKLISDDSNRIVEILVIRVDMFTHVFMVRACEWVHARVHAYMQSGSNMHMQ